MVYPEHVADLVNAITGCIDDLLAGDVAVFAVYDEFTVGFARDAFDRVETIYLGPGCARLTRQCKGDASRIDIAVQRIPPGAEQPLRMD